MNTSNLTPCIRVCKLENDVCIGCKRTTEELSNWFWYSEDQKRKLMEELKHR
jgi:predicted Fe-S protein YdhL (DUF1289 family)